MKMYHAKDRMLKLRQVAASTKRYHDYQSHLRSDKEKKLFDDRMASTLVEIGAYDWVMKEKEYMDSVGFAQSCYSYEQIKEQLYNFQKPGVPCKSYNRHYRRAFSSILAEVRKARLKTLKYRTRADIENAIPKKDTHAGFSYLETGLKTKGEYVDLLETELKKSFANAILHGTFSAPILIGYRTQGGGLSSKR